MCGTEIEARQAIEMTIEAAGNDANGWWVLNTIPLRETQNSDADVIVGIPSAGLLILEVKGWTSFAVDSHGRWSRPGARGVQKDMGDGPFAQASRQEYLLKELIERCMESQDLAVGAIPRIGSGVVFGNLTSQEADQSGWANDSRFALFRDTLCPNRQPSKNEANQILARLRALLQANPTPPKKVDNGAKRLEQIFKLLNPRRRVSGLDAFVAKSHESLNQLAETAMSATAEVLGGNRLYVEGAAGTGKTVLALQIGLRQSQIKGRPSLFLCSSPRLAAEIREVEQVGEGTVEIFTPEELLAAVAGQEALVQFEEDEVAAAEARSAVAELTGLETDVPPLQRRAYLGTVSFWEEMTVGVDSAGREYAAIVVDEAQDLWEPAFSYLSALAADSMFSIFVDPNQTTRRERAGLPWIRPDSMTSAQHLKLKRNFRNGDKIIDAVEDRFAIGYELPPRGAVPAEINVLRYTNADPFQQVIRDELSQLRAAGLDPVVLKTGTSIEQDEALSSLDIESHYVDAFKGLERKAVILALGTHYSPLDPNDEDLYVGMTRATVLLSIVAHSSMTDRLSNQS